MFAGGFYVVMLGGAGGVGANKDLRAAFRANEQQLPRHARRGGDQPAGRRGLGCEPPKIMQRAPGDRLVGGTMPLPPHAGQGRFNCV